MARGPETDSPPSLIVGGAVDASFERAVKFGDGWIAGGAAPEQFAEMAAKAKAGWAAAGREDAPRLTGLSYFSLGDDAEATARAYLAGFEAAGCDELILCPSSSDPAQVDLLADAAGL